MDQDFYDNIRFVLSRDIIDEEDYNEKIELFFNVVGIYVWRA